MLVLYLYSHITVHLVPKSYYYTTHELTIVTPENCRAHPPDVVADQMASLGGSSGHYSGLKAGLRIAAPAAQLSVQLAIAQDERMVCAAGFVD